MVPALTVLGLIMGLLSGLVIANQFYGIDVPIFLDSINSFLSVWDIFSGPIKGVIFGALIAIVGCSWGLTTSGSAAAVGESTTAAVVTALLAIFVTDFLLSSVMFQGLGSGVSLLG
jgi:phospholipid/cholesterol/gamma-HCH transport system permease protein